MVKKKPKRATGDSSQPNPLVSSESEETRETDFNPLHHTSSPIVGIVTAEGGAAALQAMFAQIQSEGGMACITIHHLDPTKASEIPTIAALLNDVSQQAAMYESRTRLQLALDAANLANWEIDLASGSLEASARHREMLGLPRETSMTTREDWNRHVVVDDRGRFYANQQQAIESGACSYENEYRIQTVKGDVRTMFSHAIIIRNEAGKATRIVGVTADVTAQRETEERLRAFTVSLESQVAERVELFEILRDVAIIANQAKTVEDAIYGAMQRISTFDGWMLAHFHVVDVKTISELLPSNVWYVRPELLASEESRVQVEEFQLAAGEHTLSFGEGWIGRVAATQQPAFIEDFEELSSVEADFARQLGLVTAMAFPIFVDHEIAGVIEFFSIDTVSREAAFLDMMHNVGIQLGHMVERKRLEEAIADATNELQRHFGRELHDSIAQQLTGLTMMAQTLQEKLEREAPGPAKEMMVLIGHLKRAHEQVRRLSRGLMPVEVDGEGIVEALHELVKLSQELYGIHCELRSPIMLDVPDKDKRIHLYRIVQEAVQNAAKHGHPTNVIVTIEESARVITISVEDDGRGFDTSIRLSEGSGLRIMRYRANLMGAHLTIDSQPGKRTTVSCRVPKHRLPGASSDDATL